MKKYALSLLILFFLVSCQENQSKKQKQTYGELVKTELSKNVKNETIFLGLKFGMGGEEVRNYFKDLVSQGKLQLVPHEYVSDKGKIYIYKFNFGAKNPSLQNIQSTFKTFYINDKLYKLRISVESEKDTLLQTLKAKLKEEYISKYGQNYIIRENDYNNSETYQWINGNMMIEISEGLSNNILIIYTNLIALKDKEGTSREVLMREV